MTDASHAALHHLRSADDFQWYVVALLAVVVWAYSEAAGRGQWDRVLLGIAFVAGELIAEMGNGLVLHLTDRAALWTTPGDTAFLLYVGINIEILFMFSLMPLVLFNLLPDDPAQKVLGVRGDLLVPVALGLFAAVVECVLHAAGALVWTWWFWNWPMIGFMIVGYVGSMWLVARLHGRLTLPARGILASSLVVTAVGLHLVLATWLGWI